MGVKVFLPAEYFYAKKNCDIYGEIQINENNSISYYIIASNNAKSENQGDTTDDERHLLESFNNFRHLGYIAGAKPITDLQQRDVSISFLYDMDTPNIYINKLSIKPPDTRYTNIFLYNPEKLIQLHDNHEPHCTTSKLNSGGDYTTNQSDDIRMLIHLLKSYQTHKNNLKFKEQTLYSVFYKSLKICFELMTKIFIILMEWQPIRFLLRYTVLYEHYLEWRKFDATGRRNVNITLDKILGFIVMISLLFFIPNPEEYVIEASHLIISKIRLLLDALKGSPIGLKLNVHLNNFFLDCFSYHIDLWSTFLNHIEPFVRQLFVPIALLGSMGLSFQLALLADLVGVVGLHAHCFYIYAAVLYKVEVNGLLVLWKLVIGKRYNILKKRAEAHNYINRQLYLATLFFTALLFLFPTILVYYVVFTSLRLCISLINVLLQFNRRRILEFPLQLFFKWITRSYFEFESLQLKCMDHIPSPLLQQQIKMCVFKLNVIRSSLGQVFSCESGVLQELASNNQMSFISFVSRILSGRF